MKFFLKAITLGMALTFQTAFADEAGPSGGIGGYQFTDVMKSDERVYKIVVRGGAAVDSIEAFYAGFIDKRSAGHHGGWGGTEQQITLDPGIPFVRPAETVSRIAGYAGYVSNRLVVNKIYIITNTGRVLVAGANAANSKYFSYDIPVGKAFAGFKGSSATLLDAVGIVWNK